MVSKLSSFAEAVTLERNFFINKFLIEMQQGEPSPELLEN
jgi:hypothetical protein